MTGNSLDIFIEEVRSNWGRLSSELVASCSAALQRLVQATAAERWLAALLRDAPLSRELYRDPAHGFLLLAHAEYRGLYRPPHDHGRGWVIYAVQQGEIEMTTYARITDPDGKVRLVKRDATLVRAGQVMVYLPGDIHDTQCMTEHATLYRFTERDLKKEEKEAHQVTRYVARDGVWTSDAA